MDSGSEELEAAKYEDGFMFLSTWPSELLEFESLPIRKCWWVSGQGATPERLSSLAGPVFGRTRSAVQPCLSTERAHM